ncbi:MAG: signal peptidase I [Alphaproteobacteria bacterium]|nr:signal peptidase I [Alphaproteobacteria bacterium]
MEQDPVVVASAPTPPPAATAATTAEPKGESWVETVKTIFYALLIALVIRTFFFQPFNIPSASMESTLLVGDYLFVEKFAYGYSRSSFPFRAWPVGNWMHGRLFGSDPARGDVVVFKMPNKNSPEYMEDFIKRVVGLPGDHIQVLNGLLYINGKVVPRTVIAPYVETDAFGMIHEVPRYRETMPNGVSYTVLDRIQESNEDNTQVFVVPPGNYFMMGDNRDNSDDSRLDVGFVPAEDLVGKAEFRFFSIDESAVWYKPWTWPGAIRFGRMFTPIR